MGRRRDEQAETPAAPEPRLERRDITVAAVLAALVLLFWWRVVLLRGFLFHDDMTMQNLPWAVAYANALRHGRLPLWLPDMWSGFPLFAEGQVGALYPANLFLFVALPPAVAVHLGLALH